MPESRPVRVERRRVPARFQRRAEPRDVSRCQAAVTPQSAELGVDVQEEPGVPASEAEPLQSLERLGVHGQQVEHAEPESLELLGLDVRFGLAQLDELAYGCGPPGTATEHAGFGGEHGAEPLGVAELRVHPFEPEEGPSVGRIALQRRAQQLGRARRIAEMVRPRSRPTPTEPRLPGSYITRALGFLGERLALKRRHSPAIPSSRSRPSSAGLSSGISPRACWYAPEGPVFLAEPFLEELAEPERVRRAASEALDGLFWGASSLVPGVKASGASRNGGNQT